MISFSLRYDSTTYKVSNKVGLHTRHQIWTFLDFNHRDHRIKDRSYQREFYEDYIKPLFATFKTQTEVGRELK